MHYRSICQIDFDICFICVLYVHNNFLACLGQSIIFQGSFIKLTIVIWNKNTEKEKEIIWTDKSD